MSRIKLGRKKKERKEGRKRKEGKGRTKEEKIYKREKEEIEKLEWELQGIVPNL